MNSVYFNLLQLVNRIGRWAAVDSLTILKLVEETRPLESWTKGRFQWWDSEIRIPTFQPGPVEIQVLNRVLGLYGKKWAGMDDQQFESWKG